MIMLKMLGIIMFFFFIICKCLNMLENTIFFFLGIMSRMLEKRSLSYIDGPIPVPLDDPFLTENVERIRICDTGMFYFFY